MLQIVPQIKQDEQLAKELQNQVNEENLLDYLSSAENPTRPLNDTGSVKLYKREFILLKNVFWLQKEEHPSLGYSCSLATRSTRKQKQC